MIKQTVIAARGKKGHVIYGGNNATSLKYWMKNCKLRILYPAKVPFKSEAI